MTKLITAPSVHTFDSTGEAYDASQCRDEIKDGDVLVVPSENVVGVLVGAWPVAVSYESGAFHQPLDTFWVHPEAVPNLDGDTDDYSASFLLAVAETKRLTLTWHAASSRYQGNNGLWYDAITAALHGEQNGARIIGGPSAN